MYTDENVQQEIKHLEAAIKRLSEFTDKNGREVVTFGKLFADDDVQNTLETLVGTLKAAKKRKIVDFGPQILFQGTHDDEEIVLLSGDGGEAAAPAAKPKIPVPKPKKSAFSSDEEEEEAPKPKPKIPAPKPKKSAFSDSDEEPAPAKKMEEGGKKARKSVFSDEEEEAPKPKAKVVVEEPKEKKAAPKGSDSEDDAPKLTHMKRASRGPKRGSAKQSMQITDEDLERMKAEEAAAEKEVKVSNSKEEEEEAPPVIKAKPVMKVGMPGLGDLMGRLPKRAEGIGGDDGEGKSGSSKPEPKEEEEEVVKPKPMMKVAMPGMVGMGGGRPMLKKAAPPPERQKEEAKEEEPARPVLKKAAPPPEKVKEEAAKEEPARPALKKAAPAPAAPAKKIEDPQERAMAAEAKILAARKEKQDREMAVAEREKLKKERESKMGKEAAKEERIKEAETERKRLAAEEGEGGARNVKKLKGAFETGPANQYFPYTKLKMPGSTLTKDDIDLTRREDYLNDAEFETVLKMSKDAWAKVPKWKKEGAKKAAGLF